MVEFYALSKDEQIKHVAKQLTLEILGSVLDHTYLKPIGMRADIVKLCREAAEIGSQICIHGSRIEDALYELKLLKAEDKVDIAAVIGFPLGNIPSESKAAEAIDVIKRGAKEVDMVINVGYLHDIGFYKTTDERSKALERFENDVKGVIEAVAEYQEKLEKPLIVKVIQENCYLNQLEKELAAATTAKLGAAYKVHVFAKTSTGFGTPSEGITKGATVEDVALMRKIIGEYDEMTNKVGIKPAGGVRDARASIEMMIAAGCTDKNGNLKSKLRDIFRIGTSSGKSIVNDFKSFKEKI